MNGEDKVRSFLLDLGLSYEEVGDGTYLINDEEKGLKNIVAMVSEPLVILRVKVMETPDRNRESLYEELLRLNAEDLIHGAYALEGDHVILIDTLEVETLDLEELRASFEAIGLALVQHYKLLGRYRKQS
ncbi:MAG: YbjN domain-containing protein [Spirochaetaceae bacterium]|nr:MAG: YbjN domain-containing protein [Spirochaetaceae bacterium]